MPDARIADTDNLRLQFSIGKIVYDAARDVSIIYPKTTGIIGSVKIKGKISQEKCRLEFGENIDRLFEKGDC